jgi:hypothetical protein
MDFLLMMPLAGGKSKRLAPLLVSWKLRNVPLIRGQTETSRTFLYNSLMLESYTTPLCPIIDPPTHHPLWSQGRWCTLVALRVMALPLPVENHFFHVCAKRSHFIFYLFLFLKSSHFRRVGRMEVQSWLLSPWALTRQVEPRTNTPHSSSASIQLLGINCLGSLACCQRKDFSF